MKFRKSLFIIAMTGGSWIGGVAQAPAPPPPPLIYEPPDVSEIKQIEFAECGYTIAFGGAIDVPKRKDGCASLGLNRSGSRVSMRMIRLSTDDLMKYPVADIYTRFKDAYSEKNKFTLLSSKSIDYFTGLSGVEYNFSDKIHYRRVRVLIKDGILYDLYIDVTNWHILTKHYPEIAAEFERESDRFFASFRLLPN